MVNILALVLSILILGLDFSTLPYATIIGLLLFSFCLTFWEKIKAYILPIVFAIGLVPSHVVLLCSIYQNPENTSNIFAYSLITLATSIIYNKRKHVLIYLPVSVILLLIVVLNSNPAILLNSWGFHFILSALWSIMVAFRLPDTFAFMNEDAVDYPFMMENLNEGVMFVDNQGKCLEVNRRWEEITGYKKDELIGQDVSSILLYQEDIAFMREQSQERLKGSSNRYELRIKTKNEGDRWVLTLGSPILNKKGKIIGSLGIMADLTKEKKMNQQLKSYAGELEDSNQKLKLVNDELKQFASIISHDLRSPLTTINGFTQLLERKFQDQLSTDAKEYIGYIQSGCSNMKEIIDGLLHLAKYGLENMKLEYHSLEDILKIVLMNLQHHLNENNVLISVNDLNDIYCDKIQMVQLFQNLIENSIKYKKEKIQPIIQINSNASPLGVEIIVSDNGIGISQEYQERIFWIFNQLDKSSTGIGLGLATCKKIINNHQGKITISSEENNGASFSIFIPNKKI